MLDLNFGLQTVVQEIILHQNMKSKMYHRLSKMFQLIDNNSDLGWLLEVDAGIFLHKCFTGAQR